MGRWAVENTGRLILLEHSFTHSTMNNAKFTARRAACVNAANKMESASSSCRLTQRQRNYKVTVTISKIPPTVWYG